MCDSVVEEDYQCPKCGGDIEDLRSGWSDEWGWYEDEPYRCNGHYTGKYPNVSRDSALNRTKSCGYFKLEDLAVKDGKK